jgi:Nucleotide-diphospho-sugar transferase
MCHGSGAQANLVMACSGLFYMKPSIASLDTLKLVFERIETEHGWDQALFNEVCHPA